MEKTYEIENEQGDKISISGFWNKRRGNLCLDQIENLIKTENKLSEISILFRIAAHTRSFEERLINLGLPYKIIGGLRFYEKKKLKT